MLITPRLISDPFFVFEIPYLDPKFIPIEKSNQSVEHVYDGLHTLAESSNVIPSVVAAAFAPKTPKFSRDKSQLLLSHPPVISANSPPIENKVAVTGVSVGSVVIDALSLVGVRAKNCSCG